MKLQIVGNIPSLFGGISKLLWGGKDLSVFASFLAN
jgi:hypothetical protein